MARLCEICGKGTRSGNSIVRRGLAKRKGGIGLNTTGVNKRQFLPNVSRIRVKENGVTRRRNVCAACLKTGKVVKP